MKTLTIDIETYSSTALADAGAFKYMESPDFEILLIAYAVDDGEVEQIDLRSGETVPAWFVDALHSNEYEKRAYNASFEFNALSKVFGEMDPHQWRCSMIHALYAGYAGSLEATGKLLGLAEDKQKLTTGKALIRYFCVPCNPTKANGGRTRNLPEHDPQKWAQFKEYNKQDVVAEMEIDRRLAAFQVPAYTQEQWETDLRINRRGVAVDMGLVEGALSIGERAISELESEAREITGLENPNSVAQLRAWLASRGVFTEDLRKDTVAWLLASDEIAQDVRRVLEIRQELGKTSTKKYDAIAECVCGDGRVRGLLQFYGANRTGRYAGRLVQVQNLPRTYTSAIDFARDRVRAGDLESIRMIYGSVNDTLSQLVRTAFIASEGNVLIDADFSAIEARVISWLAGEEWRLQAFRDGKDIYCASASQMFGVPVEKHGINGHLRQKGKIAELALGYQGSTGAMIAMGALDMGLTEEELPEIVAKWRRSNGRIQALWYEMDDALRDTVELGRPHTVGKVSMYKVYDPLNRRNVLAIRLPSSRCLFYVNPRIGVNEYGNESVIYSGIDQQTRKWVDLETYGGKIVENVTQAIARDCLAEAIERLEKAGFPIVFHVHDEVVIDMKPYTAEKEMLADVIRIMSQVPTWATGLPLSADGWVGSYFTKD